MSEQSIVRFVRDFGSGRSADPRYVSPHLVKAVLIKGGSETCGIGYVPRRYWANGYMKQTPSNSKSLRQRFINGKSRQSPLYSDQEERIDSNQVELHSSCTDIVGQFAQIVYIYKDSKMKIAKDYAIRNFGAIACVLLSSIPALYKIPPLSNPTFKPTEALLDFVWTLGFECSSHKSCYKKLVVAETSLVRFRKRIVNINEDQEIRSLSKVEKSKEIRKGDALKMKGIVMEVVLIKNGMATCPIGYVVSRHWKHRIDQLNGLFAQGNSLNMMY